MLASRLRGACCLGGAGFVSLGLVSRRWAQLPRYRQESQWHHGGSSLEAPLFADGGSQQGFILLYS